MLVRVPAFNCLRTPHRISRFKIMASKPQGATAQTRSSSSKVASVKAAELPTLLDMYKRGEVKQASKSQYHPNDDINRKIVIWKGDITTLEIDAIVNAANKSLLGGGGVDGAIHAAAGPSMLSECRTLKGANTGDSKITKGYNLPAKFVIHTVGPVYSSNTKDKSEKLLRSCYKKSLETAVKNDCASLAFSGISTGIYGYPISDATHIALEETRAFLDGPDGSRMDKIVFTCFGQTNWEAYLSQSPQYFPSSG